MNSFFKIGVLLSLATVASFALVADYRYTECSGTTIKNHARSGLDGQLSSTGATLTTGESTLSLSGVGSMSVEHDPKLDLVQSMTLALWIKQSNRGQQALITRGDGLGSDRKFAANAEYFLSINSAGKIRYKHNGISGTYSENTIPLNTWTHIVITREHTSKEIKIYINGILDSTYPYSTSPTSSESEKLLIGECSGCSETKRFKGHLDEIKLYNHALSNNSIIEIFDTEKMGIHRDDTCTVTPAPTAIDDREEVFTRGDITLDVLDNDIDNNTEDNCNIQPNSIVFSALTGAELSDDEKILLIDTQGIWSVRDTGIVTFTPNNGYTDSPTPIGYSFSDSCDNSSNEATITLLRRETNPVQRDEFIIGNRVWLDSNRNGLQDNNEVGVLNIRVILLNADGIEVERTTTNTNGEYTFNNVATGEYTVRFENLATGDNFTIQNTGDDVAIDSDVNAQGESNSFIIGESNNLNIDAGIVTTQNGNDGTNGQNGNDGADGQNGRDGVNGNDGTDGQNGRDGVDGNDGADGQNGRDGVDGNDGADGQNGRDGVDGTNGKDAICPISCEKDEHTKDCGCDCETYETSVPVLSNIGMGLMFFISTLFGILLFRKETLLTK